jgi:hypothetical protein
LIVFPYLSEFSASRFVKPQVFVRMKVRARLSLRDLVSCHDCCVVVIAAIVISVLVLGSVTLAASHRRPPSTMAPKAVLACKTKPKAVLACKTKPHATTAAERSQAVRHADRNAHDKHYQLWLELEAEKQEPLCTCVGACFCAADAAAEHDAHEHMLDYHWWSQAEWEEQRVYDERWGDEGEDGAVLEGGA